MMMMIVMVVMMKGQSGSLALGPADEATSQSELEGFSGRGVPKNWVRWRRVTLVVG